MLRTQSSVTAEILSAETANDVHLVRILEKQPVCLARLSEEGTFLAVNDAALPLLGAERLNQILDTSLFTLIASDCHDHCHSFLARVVAGESKSLQIELLASVGQTRIVELRGIPHPSPKDGVMSALCSFHDVSKYRHLELAVQDAMRHHDEQVALYTDKTASLQNELAESHRLMRHRADEDSQQRAQLEQRLEESGRHLDDVVKKHALERERLESELATTRQHLEVTLADHHAHVAVFEENHRRAEDAIEASLHQRERLEAAVANYQARLVQLEGNLCRANEAAEQHTQQREQADIDLANVQKQLDEAIAERLTFAAQLQKALKDIEEQAAQLDRLRSNHERELAEWQVSAKTVEEELTGAMNREWDLRERSRLEEAGWQHTIAEMKSAHERHLCDARQQVDVLQNSLSALRAERDAAIRGRQLEHDAFETQIAAQQAEIDAIMKGLRAAEADRDSLGAAATASAAEHTALLNQLRQQAHLVEVGRLASSIARDLAAPLSTIANQGHLLLASLDGPARQILEPMLAAAFEASMLSKSLILGRHTDIASPVSIAGIVTAMEPTLRAVLRPHISLTVLPASAELRVQIAADKLQQHVLTIVALIRAAITDAGKVSVEVVEVVLDETFARDRGVSARSYVLLAIHIDAPGIENRLPLQLFDTLALNDAWRIAGPGMVAAVQIVADAGGHVWATREGNDVVAFEIYLPKVETAHINDSAQTERD